MASSRACAAIGLLLVLSARCQAAVSAETNANNFVRGQYRELNDNGAWSWFMDPRAIIDRGRLIVGSVRARGEFGDSELPGWGNVELSILDLGSGDKRNVVLHPHFEQDDHNSPAFLVLEDGRYLAAYSKHNQEAKLYYRISKDPGNPYDWQPTLKVETPGPSSAFRRASVTYANPFKLAAEPGRLYLFHRGVGLEPNYLLSTDGAQSWQYGGHVFAGKGGYSPYLKYASNGRDTIHLVATEDHPRNYDNSLYHAFIRHGDIYASDGTRIGPLATSSNTTLRAWDLTRIYQGGPTNVAWMTDIQLDAAERPIVLFTVQTDGAGLPMGAGGLDHRFGYARWDGQKWNARLIAYAGTRLYPGEDDYTGLGSLDPQNPSTIYISTDADPVTGKPLISKASFRRFHELFRGVTTDGGKTWEWTSITSNSSTDNLRPLVPRWNDPRRVLVWMRGGYRVNRGEWTTKVASTVLSPEDWKQ